VTARGRRGPFATRGCQVQDAASVRSRSEKPQLDQLSANPIALPLEWHGQTDEAASAHPQRVMAPSPPRQPAKDDPSSIFRLLDETAQLWRRRYEREVRAQLSGMTRARCAVLSHLAQHEGVNQVTLARILDIAPISLARLIHPLEADGLVARMHDPDDRRAHVLTLTTQALPIIEQISDLTRNTYDDLQLGMSEAETSQLCAFLCRLRSKLTGRRQEDS